MAVVTRSERVPMRRTMQASWSSASCSSSCTSAAQVRVGAGQALERVLQHVDDHQELEDLALELVEAPHRPVAGVGEHLLLGLEHVLLEAVEHGAVVVDDPAHDGRHHSGDPSHSRSRRSGPTCRLTTRTADTSEAVWEDRAMDGPHLVCEGPPVAEGPVWCRPREGADDVDGTLVFTSVAGGVLSRVWPASGRVETFADTAGGANGAVAAADGGFVVAQNGGIDFTVFGDLFDPPPPAPRFVPSGLQYVAPGGAVSYLTSGLTQSPNDLCVGGDGTIYFTDPVGYPPPDTRAGVCSRSRRPATSASSSTSSGHPTASRIDVDGVTLIVVENGFGRRRGVHPRPSRRHARAVRRRPPRRRVRARRRRPHLHGRRWPPRHRLRARRHARRGAPAAGRRRSPRPTAASAAPTCARSSSPTRASPGRVYAYTGMPAPGLPLRVWPGAT